MKPWETNFARIFLLVDAQIPANALFRPTRTKLLYYVTRSHTQVQKNSSQQWRTGVMLQCPISLVSWFVKAVYLLVVHICFNSHCLLFFFLFPQLRRLSLTPFILQGFQTDTEDKKTFQQICPTFPLENGREKARDKFARPSPLHAACGDVTQTCPALVSSLCDVRYPPSIFLRKTETEKRSLSTTGVDSSGVRKSHS